MITPLIRPEASLLGRKLRHAVMPRDQLIAIQKAVKELGYIPNKPEQSGVSFVLSERATLHVDSSGIGVEGEITKQAINASLRYAKQMWRGKCVIDEKLSQHIRDEIHVAAKVHKVDIVTVDADESVILEREMTPGPSPEQEKLNDWIASEEERLKKEAEEKAEEARREEKRLFMERMQLQRQLSEQAEWRVLDHGGTVNLQVYVSTLPAGQVRLAGWTNTAGQARAALQRIKESLDRGDAIATDDVRKLMPKDLEGIKRLGDAHLKEMLEGMDNQKRRELSFHEDRYRGHGRERGYER